nr:sugar transferase [Clostridiales bacterium]
LLFSMKQTETYSRVIMYLTAVFHLALSYSTRLLWKRIVRIYNSQREKRSMILICRERDVEMILSRSSSADETGFSGVVLTDRNAEGETLCGLPVVANLNNAAHYICREWVDEVFIYAEMAELDQIQDREIEGEEGAVFGTGNEQNTGTVADLVEQCRLMAIPIHIRVPLGGHNGRSFVENVRGFNVVTMTANYASPLQLFLKRLMDIVGGAVGSVFAILIVLVFGPIIRRKSPGPVLFRQERIGQNGKHFKIYKLRTMYLDAEDRKKDYLDQNRIADGRMFKLDFDPRIIGNEILPDGTKKTGIGEWLRRYSLDEFPQFWNVLIGTMSLVGTRPPTVDEWEKYEYHHRARLSFRPGVTGMWQVSGRSEITDFEEVVRLDTEYIEHWSMRLDLKILLKTIGAVLKRDGAM